MPTVPLAALAFARSGDKGDVSDIAVFAPDEATYELLLEQVTAERVAALLGELVTGEVTRYEVRNVLALKLVCTGALGGGGPASLRADNLGKALGGAILHLPIEVDEETARAAASRPRPPRDPYAGAVWTAT
jgi:hypothetical protein